MAFALRTIVCFNLLAIFVQAVYAGQFLSGMEAPVRFHEWSAWAILALTAVQLLLAAIYRQVNSGHGLWMVLSTVSIFLAEGLQVGTGYGRFPAVHVPLGVLIFGGVLCQGVWLFRSGESKAE
ncbi:MAG TPA: hypothetical protein VHC72_10500 [Bryobacteraceae bacterium]|nr:hypothetical protein [Bryobacteraceae bacterium]